MNFGSIEIITGPVSCGKTTELCNRLSTDVLRGKKCLYLTHPASVPGNTPSGNSPSLGASIWVLVSDKLPPLAEVAECETIGIDSAHFYANLSDVKMYANGGKRVIVSGLVGDVNQQKFGCISDILPLADDIMYQSTPCVECVREGCYTLASFSSRVMGILVPVCRRHNIVHGQRNITSI